jgi:hypothetical protein
VGQQDAGPHEAAADATDATDATDASPFDAASQCSEAGATQPCGVSSVGSCKLGVVTCSGGTWSACEGEVDPQPLDTCDEGNDDSCDGITTNGPIPNATCACLNGAVDSCGDALKALGSCAAGQTTCVAGAWGPCSVQPRTVDTCAAGNDDTCDGVVNNGPLPNATCQCAGTETESCGEALGAIGNCANGSTTCSDGRWTACTVQPAAHDTCTAGDNANCSGPPNEGCACTNGQILTGCTTSLICSKGIQTCSTASVATGQYGACTLGEGSVAASTYCMDADGDGYCATSSPCPVGPLGQEYATTTQCAGPSGGQKPCGECLGEDSLDHNALYHATCGSLPPTIDAGGWSKGWNFGSCQSMNYPFTCPAGTASLGTNANSSSCYAKTISGGGSVKITRCDAGSSGTVTLEICDVGTNSAQGEAYVTCPWLTNYP